MKLLSNIKLEIRPEATNTYSAALYDHRVEIYIEQRLAIFSQKGVLLILLTRSFFWYTLFQLHTEKHKVFKSVHGSTNLLFFETD